MNTVATIERAVASYGTRSIDYRVERGGRRATVAVVVDPSEGVILRVPRTLERERVAAVVRRKGAWIVRKLRAMEDLLPAAAPREFVNGETYCYLGRQYRLQLEVEPARQRAAVALVRGRLVVRLPNALANHARASAVRHALVAWYRRRATVHMPARVSHWAAKLGIEAPPLLIREPPKRWGSCDARGNVRLNWRVMQVSPRLVDYVIAHELVHLEHRLHSADFWARLGAVMHDADARRAALRRAGRSATW